MSKEVVAILGGTGEQGLGLAYRFAAAGRSVPDRVAVPTHFYEIVVRELPNQRIDAMSIILEHVDSSPSGGSAQDALMMSGFTSLANLEALTGYDFFPDFDEDATGRVRAALRQRSGGAACRLEDQRAVASPGSSVRTV